ncbi:hypothetical protein LC593_06815 [Nostoc sp. CHAB 5844]|nr:hypothetical protein [Nostoc sp. CHAB 5844]
MRSLPQDSSGEEISCDYYHTIRLVTNSYLFVANVYVVVTKTYLETYIMSNRVIFTEAIAFTESWLLHAVKHRRQESI